VAVSTTATNTNRALTAGTGTNTQAGVVLGLGVQTSPEHDPLCELQALQRQVDKIRRAADRRVAECLAWVQQGCAAVLGPEEPELWDSTCKQSETETLSLAWG
jgi:hypothetical protein